MKLTIPKPAEDILNKLEKNKFEAYIVGGAVRDLLMGKIVTDWDFTTNAAPEQILKLFKKEEAYYNNQFGTVGVPSEDDDLKPFEITTFRSESSYSDNRRPDSVQWGEKLEDDLMRRDFTINAMAIKKVNDDYEIIDPYSGQKDLDKKLIRAVGDADERFSEDALRMMRAVRFAAQLNFEIEKNTLNAIKNDKNLINKIAKERIKDELFKIFSSDHAYQGVTTLRETGLMEEILPEAEKMFGVDQKSPQRHHIYDVGTHGMMALKHAQTDDPVTKFAIFIHDIGKPHTYKKQKNGVITFYNHEVVGARIANRIADRLKFSKKEKEKLWRLVRYHQFTVDEDQTDNALRRFIRNVTPEYVDDMLELRRSDRLGSGSRETSWRTEEFKARLIEVQKQPFTVHDLKISGTDIMKELDIKPGPQIGKILNELFKKVENKEVSNTKKDLLSKIKSIEKD